ncbi:WXG100 family type VII secretion target [Mycobacterium sp. LTG2003]
MTNAAVGWRTAATESEEVFEQHRQHVAAPGGTTWEGDAKDAALDRVTADTAVVESQVRVLREAADIAEHGGQDIQAARRKAVEAITAAENDGFRVGENLSITDTRRVDVFTMAARQTAATEHAEDVRWTAEQLVQTDTLIGQRLQAKATELDGIRFDGERDGSIQLVSNEFKESPIDDAKLLTKEQALAAWEKLQADIASYNSRCAVQIVGPLPPPQYSACQAELASLEAQEAILRARLADFGIYPGTGGDLTSIATQIGHDVAAIPKGAGVSQNATLAQRVTDLHLSQAEAAEAVNIASRTAYGATGGIANLPDGTNMVLPAMLPQRVAMQVFPDGSVKVFKGDLYQFLPYIG